MRNKQDDESNRNLGFFIFEGDRRARPRLSWEGSRATLDYGSWNLEFSPQSA